MWGRALGLFSLEQSGAGRELGLVQNRRCPSPPTAGIPATGHVSESGSSLFSGSLATGGWPGPLCCSGGDAQLVWEVGGGLQFIPMQVWACAETLSSFLDSCLVLRAGQLLAAEAAPRGSMTRRSQRVSAAPHLSPSPQCCLRARGMGRRLPRQCWLIHYYSAQEIRSTEWDKRISFSSESWFQGGLPLPRTVLEARGCLMPCWGSGPGANSTRVGHAFLGPLLRLARASEASARSPGPA